MQAEQEWQWGVAEQRRDDAVVDAVARRSPYLPISRTPATRVGEQNARPERARPSRSGVGETARDRAICARVGYDLHIIRSDDWTSAANDPISFDEWIRHAEADAHLTSAGTLSLRGGEVAEQPIFHCLVDRRSIGRRAN